MGKSVDYVSRSDVQSFLLHYVDSTEDSVRILHLTKTTKFSMQTAISPCNIVNAAIFVEAMLHNFRTVFCKDDSRVQLFCLSFKYSPSLIHGLSDNGSHTPLNDASLLASNLCESIAEKGHVIKTDVCDDRHHRRDDVRAVQPATQSHLNDGNVHLHVGEILKRKCRRQFEERRMQRLKERALVLYKVHHILLIHLLSVHPYAFAEVHKMRRSEESDPVASRLKDGS